MNTPRLATAALVTALVPAGVLGLSASAGATTVAAGTSSVTVATSDATVSSGEQFVLSGRLSRDGVVYVQSREGSTWKSLSGARVETRSDGTYRVRVQLGRDGDRLLRVVGDPTAAGVASSQARIVITVS